MAFAGRRVRRHFLFLQGGVSPFFGHLGDCLETFGYRVSRIDFCSGDCLVWRRPGAIRFRQPLDRLAGVLADVFTSAGVSDLVLFGSCRPVHRAALVLARRRGVRAHVYEEGYLRPNWLTLERGGVNGDSGLPREAAWYRRVAAYLPPVAADRPASSGLGPRAFRGGLYQLARLADPVAFPHYRSHRADPVRAEIRGWIARCAALALDHRRDQALCERLIAADQPFYLLPLQLDGDAQVACYSDCAGMHELIERVIRSFASAAPADARLLIKNHPLDTGLRDHGRQSRDIALAADVAERVFYVESGALRPLLDAAAGLVTLNSTSGLAALSRHCPTLALGRAVYGIPGLTAQGPLDRFWADPQPPDPTLLDAFRRTLVHTTQVRGDLYTARGIRDAVKNSLRFLGQTSPLEQLLERVPVVCDPGSVASSLRIARSNIHSRRAGSRASSLSAAAQRSGSGGSSKPSSPSSTISS